MHNLFGGFELNDDRVPATFALHSTGDRSVSWNHEEPKGIDVLYFTQRMVSQREFRQIESIQTGASSEINRILSSYI